MPGGDGAVGAMGEVVDTHQPGLVALIAVAIMSQADRRVLGLLGGDAVDDESDLHWGSPMSAANE